MNKVLILGSDGNLGSQLVKDFSNFSNSKVISFTRKDLDILDYDLMNFKISQLKPDIIINTVAYNAVDKCEEFDDEFKLAKKINGEALKYLGKTAIKNNSILLHYSTDYVFGGNICQENDCSDECLLSFKEKGGFLEDNDPCPINKYGLSKVLGEIELQRLASQKLKYYIVRTSKLFGPRGSSQNSKENFFDIMLKMANEKNELNVVSEELSCFTYTEDLARQSRELLQDRKDFGFYHIRNSEPAIWYDAARELFRLKNYMIKINPVSSEKFPRPAKRPKYSVLANSKLKPLRSWREALKEYLKNYK